MYFSFKTIKLAAILENDGGKNCRLIFLENTRSKEGSLLQKSKRDTYAFIILIFFQFS